MLISQLITRIAHPRVRGTLNRQVVGLTCHSRSAGPGIVFIALPEEMRGNPYQAIAAAERGAAAVICPPGVPLPERGTCITVNDSSEAFALAAAEFHERPSEHLEAISVGGPRAASVAFLLRQLLEYCGWPCGLLSSVGCKIGERHLPVAVDRLDALAVQEALRGLVRGRFRACVVEVSSATEAARNLVGVRFAAQLQMAAPVVAEEVPVEEPSAAPEGPAAAKDTIKAGTFCGTHLVLTSTATHFNVETSRGRLVIRTSLVGRAQARDLLFALRAAFNLGFSTAQLNRAASRLAPAPGYLTSVSRGQPFGVFVDGANQAAGLAEVLADATEFTRGRLFVLLGGSADHTIAERKALGAVASQFADGVVVTSDNPRELDAAALARDVLHGVRTCAGTVSHVELDRYHAIQRALRLAGPGDTVLISGKGHRCIQESEGSVVPFDDALVAREILAERGYVGAEY